jgi:uncharacterized DUF497 family protein
VAQFYSVAWLRIKALQTERLDPGGERAEVRYVTTGVANGVVLTVVYTERGERIRIISARKATKHEQEEYYRSQTAE